MVCVWLHVCIQGDYNMEATKPTMKLLIIVVAYVICARVNKISTTSPHCIQLSVYSCVKYITCMYITKKLVYNREAHENVLGHNNVAGKIHQQKGDMTLILPVTRNILEIV